MSALKALVADAGLQRTQKLVVRPLTAHDSTSYRHLRRDILAIGDGKYFNSSYTREEQFTTDDHWRQWCTESQDHCTIGTFVDEALIGVMGIVRYGTPEERTAEWEATWISPPFRGYGIAKLSYQMVERWTVGRGYQKALVYIRADNVRSREIREKQGAVYSHTEPHTVWADGSVFAAHCYAISLLDATEKTDTPYNHAINYLETTLAALNASSDA